MDDSAQLILTASLAGGRLQDLTGDIKYEVANPGIVRVSGRVELMLYAREHAMA